MTKRYPNAQELAERFSYNPETGVFRIMPRSPSMYKDTASWTAEQLCNSFNKRLAGRVAGTKIQRGYIKINVNGKQCLAHRLAFIAMGEKVPDFVDHVNGDTSDNRWTNLRACKSQSDNTKNRKLASNNRTGKAGIQKRLRGKCWEANIGVGGKAKYLGTFYCFGQALNARLAAERDMGYFPQREAK